MQRDEEKATESLLIALDNPSSSLTLLLKNTLYLVQEKKVLINTLWKNLNDTIDKNIDKYVNILQ